MKKISYLFALLGLCFISCSKVPALEEKDSDNSCLEGEMQIVTIKADIGEQTKTTYADDPDHDGVQLFSWSVGDEISVKCSDGVYRTLKATSSGTSTYFSGAIPVGVTLCERAYFPADANHTDSYFSVVKEKDMVSHPSADLPMVGLKGAGDVFTFKHCSGAVRLTLDNIPNDITSVKITIKNLSLNLSGLYTLKSGASIGEYYYEPRGKDEDGHEFFIRTVGVSNNTAQVYFPYSCDPNYGDMWASNTLDIVGYKDDQSTVNLLTGKPIPALGSFERAHVKPLKTFIVSHLSIVNWTATGVNTSTIDPTSSKQGLAEMKVTSDTYYMYVRVKAPVLNFTGNYLDVMLSDGNVNGTHYCLADDNPYWNTAGDVVYREQHKGAVTTTSLTMTFNNQSIETRTENDGTNIYWYMAFPRSAHSLLSSEGTVYVAFMLWNGWSCAGAIPTRYTNMMPVTLQ